MSASAASSRCAAIRVPLATMAPAAWWIVIDGASRSERPECEPPPDADPRRCRR